MGGRAERDGFDWSTRGIDYVRQRSAPRSYLARSIPLIRHCFAMTPSPARGEGIPALVDAPGRLRVEQVDRARLRQNADRLARLGVDALAEHSLEGLIAEPPLHLGFRTGGLYDFDGEGQAGVVQGEMLGADSVYRLRSGVRRSIGVDWQKQAVRSLEPLCANRPRDEIHRGRSDEPR